MSTQMDRPWKDNAMYVLLHVGYKERQDVGGEEGSGVGKGVGRVKRGRGCQKYVLFRYGNSILCMRTMG